MTCAYKFILFVVFVSLVPRKTLAFCAKRRIGTGVLQRRQPFQTPTVVTRASTLDDDAHGVPFGDGAGVGTLDIFASLKERQRQISLGIGKRYITRTKRGYLNVHFEPTTCDNQHNIVAQLEDGQIVTSTGPARGFWIPHDGGGWSLKNTGNFQWLEPIDE